MSLTDDEFTVLAIAGHGESMLPIGRWEPSVKSLVAKGFLHAQDKFNNTITDAGREALAARDKEDEAGFRQILESGAKISNARTQAMQSVEQAAVHLAMAARASSIATGDTEQISVERWTPEVVKRAFELLK